MAVLPERTSQISIAAPFLPHLRENPAIVSQNRLTNLTKPVSNIVRAASKMPRRRSLHHGSCSQQGITPKTS